MSESAVGTSEQLTEQDTGQDTGQDKEAQARDAFRSKLAALKGLRAKSAADSQRPETVVEKAEEKKPTSAQPDTAQPLSVPLTEEVFYKEPPKDLKAHSVIITASEVAAAESVLGEIGGGDNIIVVPDDAMMGTMAQSNPAVTIKDGSTLKLFQNQVDAFENRYESPQLHQKLQARVSQNSIVIRRMVLDFDDLHRRGTIWHEHGHVQYDAAESGRVFAYELEQLREQLGDDDAKKFVVEHRKNGGYYTEYAINPGLELLENQLQALGMLLIRGEKATRTVARKKPGQKVFGSSAKLKSTLKTDDDLPPTASTVGTQFDWAGYTWQTESVQTIYTLRVLDGKGRRNAGLQVSGNESNLMSKADARVGTPEELPTFSPGRRFEWDTTEWELVSLEHDLQLKVVKDIGVG